MTNEVLMHALRAFASGPARLYWPSMELLAKAGFETPMFNTRPVSMHVDPTTAIDAALRYTSLATTVRDTHNLWQSLDAERRANPRRWPAPAAEAAVVSRLRSG